MIDKSKIKVRGNVINITRLLKHKREQRDNKFRQLEQTLDTLLYNFKLNEEFEYSLRKMFYEYNKNHPHHKPEPVILQMKSFYENNYDKGIGHLEKNVIGQVSTDIRRYSN
ncbi:MAG: hypothetical protein PHD81_03930 [Candidatus Nanoarchaeia archaeon]|nr:hypothetical protein [Candidatus Nanoarchaeia archaeon]MDD5588231.1 hypothetical protein [Candidatus Nanoarchaeia archaeon]